MTHGETSAAEHGDEDISSTYLMGATEPAA
jgi:hypothetical protein